MTVNFNVHNYRDTHSVYVWVEGAEPIKRSVGKRLMAAEHVQVKYLRTGGEDWEVTEVHVSGGLLKNDGTPGKQIVTGSLYKFNRYEWPEWLKVLVDKHKPEASAGVAREPLVSA
jgi:hypothetical protein